MKLVKMSKELTMSSKEIAKLTGKRHDNVMTDITKMFSELGIYAPKFSGTYKTSQGNEYKCYNLPKRECLILVSGYSIKLRARIIDRWQALEDAITKSTIKDTIEWKQARIEGKVARRVETDVIKEFVEYAQRQGSKHAHHYYTHITKGTYKALFILEKAADVKNMREKLGVLQLQQLAVAENLLQRTIRMLMEEDVPYKDIYKLALAELDRLVEVLGKELPGVDNVSVLPSNKFI